MLRMLDTRLLWHGACEITVVLPSTCVQRLQHDLAENVECIASPSGSRVELLLHLQVSFLVLKPWALVHKTFNQLPHWGYMASRKSYASVLKATNSGQLTQFLSRHPET